MTRILVLVLLLATGVARADDAPAAAPDDAKPKAKTEKKDDAKLGMSILGNQEAPKALVIVPWKSSEIGSSHGVSTRLDDSKVPVDKDEFLRMLRYYEIRSKDVTTKEGA